MLTKRLLQQMLCGFMCLFLVNLARAQSKTVTGTITDEKGAPLAGATVKEKGSSSGTNTNATGLFSLTVPSSATTLVITYIGYDQQEISIKNKTAVAISLQPNKSSLNEVVVVGYGTQKRKDVTGSVVSVKGDVFKDQPVTNVTEALQGRAAGVEVIKSSGAPDAQPLILIRGTASLHQPNPLYIVDGVRTDGTNLNPQDVASVEVLKDASAAAIYGSAAAGGVILITTKKGASQRPTVNFNARYGVSQPKLVKMLDRNDWIKLQNIIHPTYFKGATQTDTLANTDWVDELYRNGNEQNYNLSVSGSSPNVNYLASGFYNGQKGIYINNFSNIGGARVNTDFKLGNYVKIGEQVAVSQRRTAPPVGSEAQLHNAPFRTQPIIPVHNSWDNSWGTLPPGYPAIQFGGPNPVGAVNSAMAQNFKNNFQGNVYGEVKLPWYLTFRTNLGYGYYNETNDYYQAPYNFGPVNSATNFLDKTSIVSSSLLTNYLLSFDHTFGKHNISALVGYEQIKSIYNYIEANQSMIGLPGYSFIQTSQSNTTVHGKYDANGLIKSQFARLNYNYNGKYYVSASVRQDANFLVFGPGKQKGVFPAFSAGWNISEEDFWKPISNAVNLLKIRGSYGSLGNSAINPYSFAASYSKFTGAGYNALGGQNFAPGAPLVIANSLNAIPNPNLHWETVYETNLGIDGEALNSHLYFTVEWYNKKTKDMLYALKMPVSAGYTSPYFVNIGSVQNKGVDLLIGYRNKAGEFNYDVSFNAGFNNNKVLDLSGIPNDQLFDGVNYYSNGDAGFNVMPNQNLTVTKAGLPFGSFYGYKVVGMFKTDQEAAAATAQPGAKAGDLIYAHDAKNGNVVSEADKQVLGNPNPKMVYGATVRVNWKGIDVAMLFNGVAGVQLFNGVKAYEMYPWADGNTTSQVFGASFLGSNQLTGQPRIGYINPANANQFILDPNGNYTKVNSYFVENGSYLKLKNLQIGYTFSNALMDKIRMRSARVFVMANNLFTITKYSGLDPELGTGFSMAQQQGYVGGITVTTRGVDAVSQYPQAKIWSVGLDLTF
ncbi:TonB-dependent receptor [Chitinophagaceae bacterium 26-R-25]|nr:TonB-dependent receptor [Chitinophagaceae bacterium 26-R-25]